MRVKLPDASLLVLALCVGALLGGAACADQAGARPPVPLTRLGTGVNQVPIQGSIAVADGRRYVAWVRPAGTLQVFDEVTGITRALPLPTSVNGHPLTECELEFADARRALAICSGTDGVPQPGNPFTGRVTALLVDFATGLATPLDFAPNGIGANQGDLANGKSFGRQMGHYWFTGIHFSDDVHEGSWPIQVELATGKVIAGRNNAYKHPLDRLPDIDEPGLPVRWCGPTWGSGAALAYPHLLRVASIGRDRPAVLRLDRCAGHTLVQRIPIDNTAGFTTSAMNSRIIVLGEPVSGLVRAYRTSDGAFLGSWTVPVGNSTNFLTVQTLGSRAVVGTAIDDARTQTYLSGDLLTNAPPPRHVTLVIHPRRSAGPATLAATRTTTEKILGPGQKHGAVSLYRYGRAQIAIRYADDRVTRITTTSSAAVLAGRHLTTGPTALLHHLPGWRSAQCRHHTITDAPPGTGPSTTITDLRDHVVTVTLSTSASRCTA